MDTFFLLCSCYENEQKLFTLIQLQTNLNCQCQQCAECMSQYFEVTIKQKHLRHLVCPICDKPNLEGGIVHEDYFSNLSVLVRTSGVL